MAVDLSSLEEEIALTRKQAAERFKFE